MPPIRGAGKAPWLVVFVFLISRSYAFAIGLRFEGREWSRFWHCIDPKLLETSLLESVYHLHSQPPLPNLLMGTSLKVFGDALPQVYALLFLVLGAGITACMYRLMIRVSVPAWTAAVLTSIWCASPGMLAFENFLFYTYPVLGMLLAAAYLLHRFQNSHSKRSLWAYCGLLTLIVLTRSLFHPAWMLFALGLPLAIAWQQRSQLWKVLCIPVLLVGIVLMKNGIEFGQFSLSSWRGMNLSRAVVDRLDKEDREARIAKGEISPWAQVGSFKPLHRYLGRAEDRDRGAPILNLQQKNNGKPNFHHWGYLEVSRQLERDVRHVIADRPWILLETIGQGLEDSMKPAAGWRALKEKREQLHSIEVLYDTILLSAFTGSRYGFWWFAMPLLLGYGIVLIVWGKAENRALWLFGVGTIVWVLLVGAMAERTENARFRYLVDPFFLLLAAKLFAQALSSLKPGRKIQG